MGGPNRSAPAVVLAVALALVNLAVGPAGADGTGARFHGSTANIALNQPVVGMAATPTGNGYWLVARDGGIFSFGDARFHGSTGNIRLNQPIVGMARSRSGGGYWLVAADGGIFNFGDARFHGSTGGRAPQHPIVGMASTPSGQGYWLAAANGQVFNFGDAGMHGSTSNRHLPAPIVAIASTASGRGYWLVAANGQVFNFGDAGMHGSTSNRHLPAPIVDVMAGPGRGYRLVGRDGRIYDFADAGDFGSAGEAPLRAPVVAASTHPSGLGYWAVTSDGTVLTFGREARALPAGVSVAPPIAGDTAAAVAAQVFGRLNAERRARGLLPLLWDQQLASSSSGWSREMASSGFRHRDINQLKAQHSNGYLGVGENIYSGAGTYADAGSAHAMLMRSSGHRSNVVQHAFSTVGVGVHCSGGQIWVTQTFGAHRAHGSRPWSGMAAAGPFTSPDEGGTRC